MHLFQNALLFDPQNISNLVLMMAGAGWSIVFFILMIDIFMGRELGVFWRLVWFTILLILPIVGGLFYSLYFLIRKLTIKNGPISKGS
jgi:hypothetical protein